VAAFVIRLGAFILVTNALLGGCASPDRGLVGRWEQVDEHFVDAGGTAAPREFERIAWTFDADGMATRERLEPARDDLQTSKYRTTRRTITWYEDRGHRQYEVTLGYELDGDTCARSTPSPVAARCTACTSDGPETTTGGDRERPAGTRRSGRAGGQRPRRRYQRLRRAGRARTAPARRAIPYCLAED
jgi:hypothetical protein